MSKTGTVKHLPGRYAWIVVAVGLAACSWTPLDGSTTTAPTSSPPMTAPRQADPWDLPDHEAPPVLGPVGSLPSLNESAGCDAPQGVRGPYATVEGRIVDTEALGGPWGAYLGRDMAEIRAHLVPMELPNGDDDPVTVFVHERAVDALQAVIDNLVREQRRGHVYPLDPSATSSFNPRTIPPKRYVSFHAVGIAIDVNSLTNPYREDNVLVTDMPAWFVAAWTEAGWCWGGSWQDIKDPMHFSWKGPRYTPGYPQYPPMPVRTPAGSFRRVLSFDPALGEPGSGATTLIADVDRDGAGDVVVVTRQPGTGRLGVQAAVAIHQFDTCWRDGLTAYSAPEGAALLMADADGDDRPDLWVVGPNGGGTSLVVYTHASGYADHLPVVRTSIPPTSGAVDLADDVDGDGVAELWVIDRGVLTVWAGPRFDTALVQMALPVTIDGSWRFATGDRGGDGVPDLFALGSERLVVLDGAGGFSAAEEVATPAAAQPGALRTGDLDGDGRADLYLVADDGAVTVFLGGDRSGVTDMSLMSWFLEHDDQPWEYRQGCPFDSHAPR